MNKRIGHVLRASVAVLVVLGGALGVQAVQHHSVNQEIQAATERVDFWTGIESGEIRGTSPDVQLARDLHELLGETDESASTLPVEVTSFEGSPNRYAGVQDELGFAPFDDSNTSCNNCGPLTGDMKENLLLIKQGNLESVLASDTPEPAPGYRITPPGVPAYAGVLFLLVTAGGYVLVPHVLHQRSERQKDKKARKVYGTYLGELDAIESALGSARPVSVHDEKAISSARLQAAQARERLVRMALAGGDDEDVSPAIKDLHQRIENLDDSVNVTQSVLRELRSGS